MPKHMSKNNNQIPNDVEYLRIGTPGYHGSGTSGRSSEDFSSQSGSEIKRLPNDAMDARHVVAKQRHKMKKGS